MARPDARRGESVTAFSVAAPETETGDLERHVSRMFDLDRLGFRVVRVATLRRLRNGKLDRRALERELC